MSKRGPMPESVPFEQIIAAKHWPKCNDLCRGEEHFLLDEQRSRLWHGLQESIDRRD